MAETRAEIDAFLAKTEETPTARLIFAVDATASREAVWAQSRQLTAKMFGAVGGLDVQLVYYRGEECKASRWVSRPEHLAGMMEKIRCLMGYTQIGRVLAHARTQAKNSKVSALVFVGDAFEENLDALSSDVAALGKLGVRAFMFQEGDDPEARVAFQKIARRTGGAYGQFDAGAAQQLAELLGAAAVFAVGGLPALEARSDAGAVKLLEQIKRRKP